MSPVGRAVGIAVLVGALAGCRVPGMPGSELGPTQSEKIRERLVHLQKELDRLDGQLSRLQEGQAGPSGVAENLESLALEVEGMHQEIRSQRGELEIVRHRLKRLKERQRRLYKDLNLRLQTLAKGTAPPASQAAGGDEGKRAKKGSTGESTPPESPQKAYKAAFAKIENNEYRSAAAAFRSFLKTYPDSDLAANARYWLGESHYVLREFEQALGEFNKVLQKHPDSRKAPAALLKIGYSFYELGEYQSARQALKRIRERFPDTSEAQLARKRLQRINKEGY